MSRNRLIIPGVALAFAPLLAGAQSPQAVPAPPDPLTAAVRRAVVDTVAVSLERFFAVADTGRLIAEHLRRRLASGAYDKLVNPALFAEAISADMKAINGDKHLALGFRTPGPALPPGTTRLPPLPVSAPAPGGGNVPPQMLLNAQRQNFSLGRLEVLPGNVGYLEIRGFSGLPQAREHLVNALRYVQHTDALIIDVRDHIGGSADLSNFLISHFTGADTLPALHVIVRGADQQFTRYTMRDVPGPRRPDVPVYILTSRGTVSAGEDFAFVMKNLGRATIVGEPTAGAGRNNPAFDVGHGFQASISISRVTDPKTGAEWEGTGVIPHVAVPPRGALEAAQVRALRALADKESNPAVRAQQLGALEVAEAALKPRVVPAAKLRAYEGIYGGERTITVEQGKLVYRRLPDRLGQQMVPLTDSTFAVGALRFTFERAGTSFRLRQVAGGETLTFPRTGAAPKIRSEY